MSDAVELWQLYDNQGRPIPNKGATKDDVYSKALLHAAAHVWIWRQTTAGIEILLQKRALDKKTWPGCYDISAAGHIDLGEDPITAALREAREEIGIDIQATSLRFIGVDRRYLTPPDKAWTENEFNWLYLLELKEQVAFSLEDGEVHSLEWKQLQQINEELSDETTVQTYVPHGSTYFALVFENIKQMLSEESTT